MSDAPPPSPKRNAPLALWRVAHGFVTTLLNLFGEPGEIAGTYIKAGPRKLMLAWLCAGEALMRRLLLIEAAAYPKPNFPPPAPRAEAPRAPRKKVLCEATAPEAWPVHFRAITRPSEPALAPNGTKRPPQRLFDAWPLAIRLEAMLRVLNDPEDYAKRLSRRLHKKPRRTRALLREPAARERQSGDIPHAPDLVGRESWKLVTQAAREARMAFNTS
ncbi:MAG: hypothetical protein ABUL42_02840 [Terricaulis silvestris]